MEVQLEKIQRKIKNLVPKIEFFRASHGECEERRNKNRTKLQPQEIYNHRDTLLQKNLNRNRNRIQIEDLM